MHVVVPLRHAVTRPTIYPSTLLTQKVLSAGQDTGTGKVPKLMDVTLEEERADIAEAVAKYVTTHYATESVRSFVLVDEGFLGCA